MYMIKILYLGITRKSTGRHNTRYEKNDLADYWNH